MILQWAVVKKNDVGINDKKIRAYIIGGARRRDGDVYPNREWGYGIFDLKGIFQTISEVYSPETQTRSSKYEEYYVNSLFIRMPK